MTTLRSYYSISKDLHVGVCAQNILIPLEATLMIFFAQLSNDTADQATDAGETLVRYIPTHLHGAPADVIQLIVFYAFLLVFAIKLVKWTGRTCFMTSSYFRDNKIRVKNNDGPAMVFTNDQALSTAKRAFKDWCWPPAPTISTPFQQWIEDLATECKGLLPTISAGGKPVILPDVLRDKVQEVRTKLTNSIYVQDDPKNLKTLGASKSGVEKVKLIETRLVRIYANASELWDAPTHDPDIEEELHNDLESLKRDIDVLRSVGASNRVQNVDDEVA